MVAEVVYVCVAEAPNRGHGHGQGQLQAEVSEDGRIMMHETQDQAGCLQKKSAYGFEFQKGTDQNLPHLEHLDMHIKPFVFFPNSKTCYDGVFSPE